MSSRDKDTKSLQDKLKLYFKKGSSAPVPARDELQVSGELERALSASSPLPRRLRAMRDITERLLTARLQQGGAERVWCLVRDLVSDRGSGAGGAGVGTAGAGEARAAALALLGALAGAPAERALRLRVLLLRWLRDQLQPQPEASSALDAHAHDHADDLLRLQLLQRLTNGGRDITCIEEQIGPLLLEWLPQLQQSGLLVEFLQLITNVVKFNATYLNEDIVHGIVNWACWVCSWRGGAGGAACVGAALALLEAVLGYSLLPRAALPAFVEALSRTVCVEPHCQPSWTVMRLAAGTDLGYAALQELAALLAREGSAPRPDAGLLRGAVFHLHAALWGARRVPNLQVSPLAALGALRNALRPPATLPAVAYEVLLAVQALLARAASQLHEPAWDALLDVLHASARHARADGPGALHDLLHDTLTRLERLADAGQYAGEPDALLELLDAAGAARPEPSALRLVTQLAGALGPQRAGWLARAQALLDKYVRREGRAAVRAHALLQLHALALRTRALHEEEVLERALLPGVALAAGDGEAGVRAAGARVATELALACGGEAVPELLEALERVLNRPFEVYATESSARVAADADPPDVRLALTGLTEVYYGKLLRAPAAHAARAFTALLEHVERQYRGSVRPHHGDVRAGALRVLLALRTGAGGGAGGGRHAHCSPHLLVSPPAAAGAGALPLGRVLAALAACLAREREWRVLEDVLARLPALVVGRGAARRPLGGLDALAAALLARMAERATGAAHASLQGAALPTLAALAPCHKQLEPHTQQRIVRALLKYGVVLRQPSSAQCISALTLWTLEARDTMVKMLPEVLLDLSKISDTKAIAAPMLEFLSTLTRLPRVFASFVEDQYMAVFAIVLPYTNPSRYCHYVVSLAHHVVAAWFLKCRRPYRRNFVPFIIHGLHNYIIMPFEEQLVKQPQNEDSSNRKRSSSLGSKGAGGVRAPLGPRGAGGAGAGGGAAAAGASAAFHLELTETCVDLLARYAYAGAGAGGAGAGGKGGSAVDALLEGGPSDTWLVGHKLVTITTSGCQQLAPSAGICDRCAQVCRRHADSVSSPLPPPSLDHQTDPPSDAQPHTGPSEESAAELRRQVSSVSDYTSSDERLDRLVQADAEGEEGGWSRVGALVAAGACGCVCGGWCSVRVRTPAGDARWLLRLHEHAAPAPAHHALRLLSLAQAMESEERQQSQSQSHSHWSEESQSQSQPRPRSSSASQRRVTTHQELCKSSSDTVVATAGTAGAPGVTDVTGETGATGATGADATGVRFAPSNAAVTSTLQPLSARPAHTSPIDIPGSPQRQSSSSATDDADDDDVDAYRRDVDADQGRARHPVRRSNSSPEMSSSWKLPPPDPPRPDPPSAAMSLHASKKAAKKSDTRVSCEAIPEEMSGTSPAQPQPQVPPATATATAATATTAAAATAATAVEELPPLARSKRSNTISVMSPTRRRRSPPAARPPPAAPSAPAPALAPAFLLLQLYHNMPAGGSGGGGGGARPLRVRGVQHERTLKNLDLVPPVETYKVGVLYVGPGQHDNEVLILRNQHGSARYCQFLSGLGSLVELADAAPELYLNQEAGGDGTYTYVWHDDVMQVQFHVATAMPAAPNDPNCNEKRKFIGNDHVSVVYNDSGHEFSIHTIKGQLNLCIVVVEPLPHGVCRVSLRSKDERVRTAFLPHVEPQHASDHCAALLARQMALHAALAAHISQSLSMSGAGALPYASNALERLRVIKRLRARLLDEREQAARAAPYAPYAPRPHAARRTHMDDFTEYT